MDEGLNQRLRYIEPHIDRLVENLGRIYNLVRVHEQFHGGAEIKEEDTHKTDILRAAVVFVHASLEDFLRSLAATHLPQAGEDVLNTIPLKGLNSSGRPEKFFLGKLVAHKGKSVEQVIEESVVQYLERSNYSDVQDIASLLSSIGIDVSKVNEPFAQLERMMYRRHLIVHRADRLDITIGEKKYAKPLSAEEVDEWINSTRTFMVKVLGQIRVPETERKLDGAVEESLS